jgi:nucleotide-binding universal stress UspA family protein
VFASEVAFNEEGQVERKDKMFERILVPLDGSRRAEQAILYAARIVRATRGTVILLGALNPEARLSFGISTPQDMFSVQAELGAANHYLDEISQKDVYGDTNFKTEAMLGSAAEVILDSAETNEVDLIVLSSHGHTGSERWSLGSVAQKIVRHSPIPVLLVHGDNSRKVELKATADSPIRVLVTLDGSNLSESILTPAVQLVSALNKPVHGALHLIEVVTEQQAVQDLDEARSYLSAVVGNLNNGVKATPRIEITASVVISDDVAEGIVNAAESGAGIDVSKGFDLIALATHGRGGILRWMLGSVAERVLNTTRLPVLVVRPHATSEE